MVDKKERLGELEIIKHNFENLAEKYANKAYDIQLEINKIKAEIKDNE